MNYRVLIVDDDEDARVLLIRALSKAGLALEVTTAADGRQALELVVQVRPHAVITDVMMPRLDGVQLCSALRADPCTAATPIIIVTALEEESDRRRGLAAGADDYFTKPFPAAILCARLAELLATAWPER